MEIEMEEIIVDEEVDIGDIELDVIKEYSGEGTGTAIKEVHIGAEEPTGEETIWIDPTEEADKIPTKTSELENDSGFLERKGTFGSWEELNDYEFKDTETFLFYLSGEFYLYSGLYIGSFDGYKSSTGSYIYKYINSYNVDTQKSITLDLLNKTVTVNQMNIQDTNDYFNANGLDDILQEIGGQLNGVEELLGGI